MTWGEFGLVLMGAASVVVAICMVYITFGDGELDI